MAGLASQEALAKATDRLLAQAASWDDTTLETVADDVSAFSAILRTEAGLRRVLTDATVAAEAKTQLVDRLLREKVTARSLDVIGSAVADRWNSARDLRHGLQQLARTALFLCAERAGTLDNIEDELFRFGRLIDAHPELSLILDDPTTSAAGRQQLVSQLLDGRVAELTERLLVELARFTSRTSYLDRVNELVAAAAHRRNELIATVTSAIELSSQQHEQLRAALARIYTRDIALHVIVDPRLQGGIRVRVGDEVIDGSISGRLAQLRHRLAG